MTKHHQIEWDLSRGYRVQESKGYLVLGPKLSSEPAVTITASPAGQYPTTLAVCNGFTYAAFNRDVLKRAANDLSWSSDRAPADIIRQIVSWNSPSTGDVGLLLAVAGQNYHYFDGTTWSQTSGAAAHSARAYAFLPQQSQVKALLTHPAGGTEDAGMYTNPNPLVAASSWALSYRTPELPHENIYRPAFIGVRWHEVDESQKVWVGLDTVFQDGQHHSPIPLGVQGLTRGTVNTLSFENKLLTPVGGDILSIRPDRQEWIGPKEITGEVYGMTAYGPYLFINKGAKLVRGQIPETRGQSPLTWTVIEDGVQTPWTYLFGPVIDPKTAKLWLFGWTVGSGLVPYYITLDTQHREVMDISSYNFAASGVAYSRWLEAESPEGDIAFSIAARCFTHNSSGAGSAKLSATETVDLAYQLDHEDEPWTGLPQLNNQRTSANIKHPHGQRYQRIRFRATLNRDPNTATLTPAVKLWVMTG